MTPQQFAAVLSHLSAGAELSVRNQDGWWGLRGAPEGIIAWSRYPYEAAEPDRLVTATEVRAMIGGWDLDVVRVHLSPPLDAGAARPPSDDLG